MANKLDLSSRRFVHPEFKEGKVKLSVMLNGKEIHLVEKLELTYESQANLIMSIMQIYINLMCKICDTMVGKKISMSELDNELASLFSVDSEMDVEASAFESLFGIYRNMSRGGIFFNVFHKICGEDYFN